ncbi:hypothetical protein BK125_17210 [Paenibacillus odorifer]|uniref:Peptidase G2 IMC autoproteolytic cleavage domain-containing protein n=1 Tax=Paenibacillus odorifer TaxID=189426 RepID=A0ABX3GMA9_9BACL|nr:hypothetical protein [Paenibacillus odorifer]OMC76792.1 hypothetical protein BK125_17210 [Paenibacillus odorifer]OMD33145.1 hypothetical protein BSO21_15700 [Paenibacillus odorifer]
MSLCFSYFGKNQIFVCADSRVCIGVNGENHHVTDDYRKIRRVGNKVLFISGEVEVAEKIFNNIGASSTVQDIKIKAEKEFRYYEKLHPHEDAGIIVKILLMEKQMPAYYFFNSKDFVLEKQDSSEGQIYSIGAHQKEAMAYCLGVQSRQSGIGVDEAIISAYHHVADETVGGNLHCFLISNDGIAEGQGEIEDSKLLKKANGRTFPYHCTLGGNLVARNATLVNADISGNINMTSGTMSWSNINSDPTISTAQTTANTAINGVSAIASGTYSGTFINGKMIYSPTLQGGRIIGNSIEGSTITGATIIGGLFKTADSGNRIELNSGGLNSYNGSNQLHGVRIESSNYSSLGFWSDGTFRGSVEAIGGSLQIKPSGGDLVLNANTNTVVMHGKVDFSDAIVTGLVPVFG